MKGNMLDLAVGVIVGGAFKTVVDALTNSVIMPVVSMFLGGLSFGGVEDPSAAVLRRELDENGEVIVNYLRFGDFTVRIHQLRHHGFCRIPDRQDRQSPAGPGKSTARRRQRPLPRLPSLTKEEQLLTEIRDLLKKVSRRERPI